MSEPVSDGRRQADRMIFFSDAVFAIALTLLALELAPPPPGVSDQEFWAELRALAPQLGALLISFALGALWWLVHMAATRELKTFDGPTAVCNLLFLLFIVLLPFAAATFGNNINGEAPIAVYWMINAGAAFAMTLMFFVMTRGGGYLIGGISGGERALRLFQSVAPGIVFALGAYWALAGEIWLSRFCCVLLAPLMMTAGFIARRMERKRKAAA